MTEDSRQEILRARTERITRLTALLAPPPDPRDGVQAIAQRIAEAIGADAAVVLLGSEPSKPGRRSFPAHEERSAHVHGAPGRYRDALLSPGPKKTLASEVDGSRSPLAVSSLAGDPRFSEDPALAEGFSAAIGVPISGPDAGPGTVLALYRSAPADPLGAEELSALAALAGAAIDRARLHEKTEESFARLRALSEITRAIASTLDVEGVFRILGEQLQRIVAYRRLSLKILQPGEAVFQVRSISRPEPGHAVIVRLEQPMSAEPPSVFVDALAEQRPLVIDRPGDPEEIRRDSMFAAGVARYVIVPIIADQLPMGVLAVGVDDHQSFRSQQIELLEDVASHMSIALKNGRIFANLERTATDLRDTKDRLVRSEKLQALGELAAGVAHDFNNILSAILGRAQMLKVMLTDETSETLKSVSVIEQAALDGAGTVRRIQEFAKAKSDADFVPVQLNTLVRDTVERTMTRVRASSQERPIEVAVELGEAGSVVGSPSDLRQVLTNLIYNSIDALGRGGRLVVRTGREEEKPRVWFEVEDTGHGMDEETLSRMFSPFFTTKGSRGTGLGLSVSFGIVERHRGEFSVWSAKGQGTRIRVFLPAHREAVAARLALKRSVSQRSGGIRHARILVIDDDAAVRDVLADILRTGDHQVVAAPNGPEGLALFRDSEFDLVFTDLGMPGMNGWEVAAGIKSASPSTPVGLITGWGASLDENRMKDLGVDLIVSKPFRYQQVLELVSEAMELKRLRG